MLKLEDETEKQLSHCHTVSYPDLVSYGGGFIHVQKLFDILPSRKWSLILLALIVDYILMTRRYKGKKLFIVTKPGRY